MKSINDKSGFTLIEVLIALAITSIVIGGATTVFVNLQKTSTKVDQRTNLSANARGAMFYIEDTIKLLGFNPDQTMSGDDVMSVANAGQITFVQNDLVQGNANQTITIRLDLLGDATSDGLADAGGTANLVVGNPAGPGNVANNVVAIGFAYGYDDGWGNVETAGVNNQIVWAIDSDGDGDLDETIDNNNDGVIDAADLGVAAMGTQIPISDILAVKVWLLVRSRYQLKQNTDNTTYFVGANSVTPNNSFAHVLHTTTIKLRNMF